MIRHARLALFACLFALLSLPAHAMVLTPTFAEVGDAADFLSPQDVAGMGINAITGNIGGTDTVDAFRFYFGGGSLAISARALVPNDSGGFDTLDLPITLFGEKSAPTDPCAPTEPCRGTGSLYDFVNVAALDLAAGNYIVGVCQPVDPCLPSDPPYTIDFYSDLSGTPASISAPIPEPTSLALMAIGVAGLGASLRRRPSS